MLDNESGSGQLSHPPRARYMPGFCPGLGAEYRLGWPGARGGAGRGRGPSARGCGAGCGPHLPISRTIKTTFKFFSPALMSFMKRGGSLTPSILRQVLATLLRRPRWAKLPTLRGQGQSLGGGGEVGNLGRGWRPGSGSGYFRGRGDQPWRHHAKRKKRKKTWRTGGGGGKKKKTLTSSKIKKTTRSLGTPCGRRANEGACGPPPRRLRGWEAAGTALPDRVSLPLARTHTHGRTHAHSRGRPLRPRLRERDRDCKKTTAAQQQQQHSNRAARVPQRRLPTAAPSRDY